MVLTLLSVSILGGVVFLLGKEFFALIANAKKRQAMADILSNKLNVVRRKRENWLNWMG